MTRPTSHNHTAQNGRIILAAAILGAADIDEVDVPIIVVLEVVVFVPLSPVPVHKAVAAVDKSDDRLDAATVQFAVKKT